MEGWIWVAPLAWMGSRRDDETQPMLAVVGAHQGQPSRSSALSLTRDSPDVVGGSRCEDGGVGTTVLTVDDHRDFRQPVVG